MTARNLAAGEVAVGGLNLPRAGGIQPEQVLSGLGGLREGAAGKKRDKHD